MASSPRSDRPLFVIIAGPNGSGKSSAYQDTETRFQDRTIWIVNPDVLAARLHVTEGLGPGDANLAAVQRIETWLEASIAVHKSVGVETVLSTDKYRRLVTYAQKLGFEVWLFYVVLDDVKLNIERVRTRVRKGGHAVAEADIRKRYPRSIAQMPWFLEAADYAILYDNSGAASRRVGLKEGGVVTLDPSAPKVLRDALLPA